MDTQTARQVQLVGRSHHVYRNPNAARVSWLSPGRTGVWKDRLAEAARHPGDLFHVARNCDENNASALCDGGTRDEHRLPGHWLVLLIGTDLYAMLLEDSDHYIYDWKKIHH